MRLQIVLSIPLADDMFADARTTHEVGEHLKTFVNTLEGHGHSVTMTSRVKGHAKRANGRQHTRPTLKLIAPA